MAPVSPLAHHESFEDERLMMEILRGSPALSAFRINKLLARFQAANLRSAPYMRVYSFCRPQRPAQRRRSRESGKVAQVWPELKQPYPKRQATARYPRPGTISPWSSKATDIAHNCGLSQVVRLERGVAYYVEASALMMNSGRWWRPNCMTG